MRMPLGVQGRACAYCNPLRAWLAIAICVASLLHVSRARADDAETHLRLNDDYFIDAEGQERRFRATYERIFGDGRPPPDYLRTVIESTAILAIGTVWYWKSPSLNTANYDFTSPLDKLSLDAIRFDNNLFVTNMALHPVAGSAYYTLARLNHLSVPASAAFAVGYSTLWEYVLEWREKASINDLVVTPLGGIALGEWFYRLIDYMGSAPAGGPWPRSVARYGLGWPRLLHEAMDGRFEEGLPLDSLGMTSAYSHLFRLMYGAGSVVSERGDPQFVHGFSVESEFAAMPGFLQHGRFHLMFDEGNFTDMRFRMGFSPGDGIVEADLWFHSGLFGYYAQDFPRPLYGEARAFALTVGYAYHQSWLSGSHDEFAFLHLPGFAWDEWLAAGRFLFHGQLEASFDFGANRPTAFTIWRNDNPEGEIKSVLYTYGYDFYFGGSGRLLLSVVYANFEAGLRFGYGGYHSIQGVDRKEEAITRSTVSTADVLNYRAWLGYQPFALPLELRAVLETWMHGGSFEHVERSRSERWIAGELGLVF
jgi:hypothetical protein